MKNTFHSISWRIREMGVSIHNLIKWFPIVWKDRDWDFSFTYNVMQFKLEQQSKYLTKRNTFVNTPHYISRANVMSKLIERCRDGYYADEYFGYFEMDFEFKSIPDKPSCSTLETSIISDNLQEYFAMYPRVYKQVLAGKINTVGGNTIPHDNQIVAMYIADYNQQRCKKLLFQLMERHLENLWD